MPDLKCLLGLSDDVTDPSHVLTCSDQAASRMAKSDAQDGSDQGKATASCVPGEEGLTQRARGTQSVSELRPDSHWCCTRQKTNRVWRTERMVIQRILEHSEIATTFRRYKKRYQFWIIV